MILNMTGGAGGSGKSEIIVTAPAGSTVTVQRGDETPKAAAEVNGVWTFKGCDVGSWVVHAVSADEAFRKDVPVDITEEGQLMRYYVEINYRTYLYKSGDTTQKIWSVGNKIDVDQNGYNSGYAGTPSVTYGSDSFNITIAEGKIGVVYTSFDLSKYNTLNVEFKSVNIPSAASSALLEMQIRSTLTGYFRHNMQAILKIVYGSEFVTDIQSVCQLDVSSINQKLYVAFVIYENIAANIKNIWLE